MAKRKAPEQPGDEDLTFRPLSETPARPPTRAPQPRPGPAPAWAPPSPAAGSPTPPDPDLRVPLAAIPGLDPRLPPLLAQEGYGDLWPSQQEAAPLAVAGESLVLAVPTASGKSLVAYLALLTRALRGGKGLYIVPLRALAAEKHEDLKRLCGPLGLRVALAMGDLDEEDPHLARFDIVVATSEKADALLRHRANWLREMSCIVADEVHLLGDAGRGPTLEVLLARFRQLHPQAQIVALSATIANSRDLATWLGARHVKTDWRPVTLREGIMYGRGVQFLDNSVIEVASDLDDSSLALVEDSARGGGSVIVFVSTRKQTEALADKLPKAVRPHLSSESARILKEEAEKLKGADETSVERRLAKALVGGAAFHHAGLRNTERALVERLFKEGHLRALAATPTLAAGVNLPARRVVVRDLFRFDANEGNRPIPVLDYKQMAGRAGRPRFDKVGEAITIAKTADQRQEILLSFLLAETERVTSKLGTEPALRAHILSSIASEYVRDEKSLKAFIDATFYAFQSDAWTLTARITSVLDFLLENDLIVSEGDALRATTFGKRVSELYVDPLSAVKLRKALARAGQLPRLTPMSFLHAVCATPDMIPLYVRRQDAWLDAEAAEREKELLLPPGPGADYEFFLSELKTASLLHDWIEESTEDEILTKYGAYPGDITNKVDSAAWLLHAMGVIAGLFQKDATRLIRDIEARVVHGAKAELLDLIALRGVGRFRARKLHAAGYTSRAKLKGVLVTDIARVPGIGPTLAASIAREVGGAEPLPEPVLDAAASTPTEGGSPRGGQRSLADFGGP